MPKLRRNSRRSTGFTLIELIVVIFIIAILIVVLLVVVLGAMKNKGLAETQELFTTVKRAMTKYKDANSHLPGAGIDPSPEDYKDGEWFQANHALYLAVRDNSDPDEIKRYVRYYVGSQIKETGAEEEAIFVDGWGTPIIYWEWGSTKEKAVSEFPGHNASSGSRSKPGWADKETGDYSLWSAGADEEWGTSDDIDIAGQKSPENPFK